MLAERIAAFVRGESGDSFDELALAVFAHHYRRSAPFRELCDRRGAAPPQVSDWREIPALPAPAGASPDPAAVPAAGNQPYRDLHRTVIDRSLPAALLAGIGRPPVLSLIPAGGGPSARSNASTVGSPAVAAGSPADHVLQVRAPDSAVAAGRRGIEVAKARSFLAARQRDRRPLLILATAATLVQLLESLERRGLRFRLPPGSRLVETGARGPGSRELLTRLAEGLAVPPEGVFREYRAGALPTRFYAGHESGGKPRPFRPPPWTRVRVLDPRTLIAAPPGAAGSLSIFDLAALGAPPHLSTGDLGTAGEEGFRLAG